MRRPDQIVPEGGSSPPEQAPREEVEDTPVAESPPVINATLGIIGEALYPPLQLAEILSEGAGVEHDSQPINLDFFMIPDAFNETFKSRWSAEDLSHGRINPIHNYGGTTREISLSFTLAAFTVAESRSNLRHCQKLARTVYGRYKSMSQNVLDSTGVVTSTRNNTVFGGHKEFRASFGNLLQYERVFINKFNFTADMDAGVFDYSVGDDTDVTHSTKGVILPRAVKIEIGFTVVHDTPLGFGGENRPGEPLRWAHNPVGISRDWPHGTGIGVQEYMLPTAKQALAKLPRVIHPNDGADFDSDQMNTAEAIRNLAEGAISDAATRGRVRTARQQSALRNDEEAWQTSVIAEGNDANATEEEKQLMRDVEWVQENPE